MEGLHASSHQHHQLRHRTPTRPGSHLRHRVIKQMKKRPFQADSPENGRFDTADYSRKVDFLPASLPSISASTYATTDSIAVFFRNESGSTLSSVSASV